MRFFKRRHPPFYGGGSGSWWETEAPETFCSTVEANCRLTASKYRSPFYPDITLSLRETQFGCIFFSSLENFAGLPISKTNAVACSVPLFKCHFIWTWLKGANFLGFTGFFQHYTNNNHKYWLMLSGPRCTFTEDRYCAAAKCTLSMSNNLLDAIFLLIAVHFALKSRLCTNILMLVQYCGVVGVVVIYIVTCGVPTFYKSVAVPQRDGWLSAALPNSYPWSDRVQPLYGAWSVSSGTEGEDSKFTWPRLLSSRGVGCGALAQLADVKPLELCLFTAW